MAKADLDSAQIKLDTQGLDPISKRNRKDNTQLELVDDPADDWFRGCDDHLKHANIRRQFTWANGPNFYHEHSRIS